MIEFMNKFYIVRDSFFPGTAPTNRMMGFLKEFSKEGVDCDVVFFMPDFALSHAPALKNVHYHYYWRFLPFTNNYLRQLLYMLLYVFIFCLRVKSGDTVLLLGCDELVPLLVKKKGVRVYQERTEHTDFSRNRLLNYNKYYSACNKLSGLFLISQNLKDYYCSKGIDAHRIHIINMTVDVDRFKNLNKQQCEPYIAYCGSAFNNKDGVDELIKAFAIFNQSFPDVKLYIIGSTRKSSEMSANLELINTLGVQDSVVLTGSVDSERIPQLLKNAMALALDRPANKQAHYGFPTKLGEYLMTENPVIVTNVGNIRDFLEDQLTAYIAEPQNPSAFAGKLKMVFSSYEDAKRVGRRGYDVALKHFDSSSEARKILQVLRIVSN